MAKKKIESLIDEISDLQPVPKKVPPSWHSRLKQSDAPRYNEVVAVVKDYIDGGVVSKKFPTAVALHQFLTTRGVLVGVTYQQFKNFMALMRG